MKTKTQRLIRILIVIILFALWGTTGMAAPANNSASQVVTDARNSPADPLPPIPTIDHAYSWHTFYGGTGVDQSFSIATDSQGNIYITGNADLSFLGEGGAQPLHPHSAGNNWDIMVMKLSRDGAYQWHTFFGGTDSGDYGKAIAVDDAGNVYVTGESGSRDIDDWGGSHLHDADSTLFVLKLNSSGEHLWHTFYGEGQVLPFGMAVNENGEVYVTGESAHSWLGDENVDPLHAHTVEEVRDVFVLKLNTSGAYQWHTFYGCSSSDSGQGIVLDSNNDPYITGYSDASWLGDGNTVPRHAHAGASKDVLVMKLTNAGVYQWHTFYGATSVFDTGYDISTSGSNLFISGESRSSWLGSSGQSPIHSFTGSGDISVLALTTTGDYVWHTFYGSSDLESGHSIAMDGSGGIYVASDGASWSGDGGALPLHENSGCDNFSVLKLNSSGVYQWHTFYGPFICGETSANGIAVDTHGDLVVTGDNGGTWLGDDGENPLHTDTGADIYIQKFAQPDAQATIVPLNGGILNFDSGEGSTTTITVPANAVTQTVTLAYTQWFTVTPPSSLGYGGIAFNLNAYTGTTLLSDFAFSLPVTVTIGYSDDDISGLSESALLLYYWDEATSTWIDAAETCTPTSQYTRDLLGNSLSVPICHLTRFGLFSESQNHVFLPILIR